MFVEQVLYQIPVDTSLVKLSNVLNIIFKTLCCVIIITIVLIRTPYLLFKRNPLFVIICEVCPKRLKYVEVLKRLRDAVRRKRPRFWLTVTGFFTTITRQRIHRTLYSNFWRNTRLYSFANLRIVPTYLSATFGCSQN